MACPYKDIMKCAKCGIVQYRKCPTFIKAHLAFLCREIAPFKYRTFRKVNNKSVQSPDVDRVKTYLATVAFHRTSTVKKLTRSQAMQIILENLDLSEYRVVYLDATTKVSGEVSKVNDVCQSFIDRCELNGIILGVYTNYQFQNLVKI